MNASTIIAQNKMVGIPFITIGNEEGCSLLDLRITGYQESSTWQGSGFTQSYIQMIKSSGVPEAAYTWIDICKGGVWEGGYWQNRVSGKKVVAKVVDEATEELPIVIPVGTGLWCNFQKAANNKKIYLTSSGEVLQKSQAVLVNSSSIIAQNKAICNPLAREVDLTEVKLDGYQESSTWQGSGFTQSYIQIIKSSGAAERAYTWIDIYKSGVWEGGYWQNRATGKKVVKEVVNPDTEETATLPAGQGLWCNFQKAANNKKIYIVWPKLEGDDAE